MATPVKVWDLGVRLFHWSLVLGFTLAWLSAEDENRVHLYFGYAIAALLVFRLIWGLIGSTYARFASFLFSPRETLGYLRSMFTSKPRHYLGHNPLGALMIFALLFSLSGTVFTGLVLNGDIAFGAPTLQQDAKISASPALAKTEHEDEHDEDDDEEDHEHVNGAMSAEQYENDSGEAEHDDNAQHEWWEEWHEAFANLTLMLIALHLVGVIVAGLLHKENLVKAMITGYKNNQREN